LAREADDPRYTARTLGPDTWDDRAALVEANNGCGAGVSAWASTPRVSTARTPRSTATPSKPTCGGEPSARCSSTRRGLHGLVPVRDPTELPNIKNRKAYARDLGNLPDWRIGCIFTDKSNRGRGGAPPQRVAYLHTGPESLFEDLGFSRDRRIGKWRWVMSLRVAG
jgi:hypothetical protein